MYTVGKAPSRLASKATRRGPAQQLDLRTLESLDSSGRERFGPWEMSSPKPVFNGKKHFSRSSSSGSSTLNGMSNNTRSHHQENTHLQQHEENVRFMAEAWYRVNYELEKAREGIEFYQEKCPIQLQGFEAIDLEEWAQTRRSGKN